MKKTPARVRTGKPQGQPKPAPKPKATPVSSTARTAKGTPTPASRTAKPAGAPARPATPAPRIAVVPPVPPAPRSAKPNPSIKPATPTKAAPTNGTAKPTGNGSPAKPAPKPIGGTPPAKSPTKAAKGDSAKAAAAKPELVIPPDKDLTTKGKVANRDRIIMMVPDPYWLHVYWELTVQSVHRAEAALGQDWHGAKPIIRLFDVTSTDTTSTSEAALRDIVLHGGCNHWYIDVPQPPRSYRADIGYVSKRGQFFVLARSNVVTPPKAGATEVLDDSWAADIDSPAAADRILAMSTGFEHTSSSNSQLKDLLDEQFRRPAKEGQFGGGASPGKLKKFAFDINAELIVYGQTDPTATVRLQNEPVKLRPDGTFTMRFSLPDSRQIIPAVATSADGLEEQTIVLAVERNIKRLDPMVHDLYGEA